MPVEYCCFFDDEREDLGRQHAEGHVVRFAWRPASEGSVPAAAEKSRVRSSPSRAMLPVLLGRVMQQEVEALGRRGAQRAFSGCSRCSALGLLVSSGAGKVSS